MRRSYALIGLAVDADLKAVLAAVKRNPIVSTAVSVTGEFDIIAELCIAEDDENSLKAVAAKIATITGISHLRHCVVKHPQL